MPEYRGKCPNCQGQLIEKGEHLECEAGDYKCERLEFERLWDEYEADVQKFSTQTVKTARANLLLRTLRAACITIL